MLQTTYKYLRFQRRPRLAAKTAIYLDYAESLPRRKALPFLSSNCESERALPIRARGRVVKATDSLTKGSNLALDILVAVRNSSLGRPEPCEGNLVAAAGSCGR